MKNEDKQLLLTDLCGRLPYGVIVHGVFINYNKEIDKIQYEWCDTEFKYEYLSRFETVKPYLRPMSDMTESEKEELLNYVVGEKASKYFIVCDNGSIRDKNTDIQNGKSFKREWVNFDSNTTSRYIDWLNEHHLDFRGLIEKGLALPAPKDMYNIK